MVEKKHVALFIEWGTSGRDFEIDLPLMYFFEKYLGWQVIYESIFNLSKIISTRPDLIIMSNTTGARENVKMAKLIERSRFPFFSHISEGMFRESDIEEFVWGWNKLEKKFSELSSGVWSKKSFDMAVKAYPELNNIYKVTGAVGFDKYKIYSKKNLNIGNYSKVVGYAAFDFNNIKAKKQECIKTWGAQKYNNVMCKPHEINETLRFIIDKNRDILFLLKPHPGDGSLEPLEFEGLRGFDNVEIIDHGISIFHIISNCDIWINYNSTTNLEAWLLDKPTISLNIDEKSYSSDILYGSIINNDKHIVHRYIDEFYQNGNIYDFEKKSSLRHKLISEYIGFSDGMNHVRFMSFLREHVDMVERGEIYRSKWNITLKTKISGAVRHCLVFLATKFPKLVTLERWRQPYRIFAHKELEQSKATLYKDFDEFYSTNKNAIDNIYKNWSKTWKNELGITK